MKISYNPTWVGKSVVFPETPQLTSFILKNKTEEPAPCDVVKSSQKNRPHGLSSLLHIRYKVITVLLKQFLAVVHSVLVNLPIYRIHQHCVLLVKSNEEH